MRRRKRRFIIAARKTRRFVSPCAGAVAQIPGVSVNLLRAKGKPRRNQQKMGFAALARAVLSTVPHCIYCGYATFV
jgi:hypothetical protein